MTIKILVIYGGQLKAGGMETYLINYFKKLQGNNYQIDFIVTGKEEGIYDDYIINKGGRVFYVTSRRKNFFKNIREMKVVISKGKYDIVHCHMDAANYYGLKIAAKCGVKIRISHSHNSNYLTNNKLKVLNLENIRKKIPKYATHLFACSEIAGKWLYGDKFDIKNKNCYIVPNAIETDKFLFNENMRVCIRKKNNISNFIVGHVGRFDTQKNHQYLIEIIRCVIKQNNDITFYLFGEGALQENIKSLAIKYKLEKNICFMGNKSNMCDYYNAMDLFILPSLFEGLPLTMIEAQANGLNCLVSDRITQEAKMINSTIYIPIDVNSITEWTNHILHVAKLRNIRIDESKKACQSIIAQGYDLNNSAIFLSNLFKYIVNEK